MGTSGLSAGRYALGVVSLLVICGALGYAALRLRRLLLPGWCGATARLAEALLALALLTAEMQLLGVVGLFRLLPLLGAALLAALAAHRVLPEPGGGPPTRDPEGVTGLRWRLAGWIPVAIAAALVAAEWTAPTLISYRYGIRTFDSLWYHLPWAASFAQSGQITTLHFTDVEYLTAFYPATAELFHGLGIVLFGGGDLLSPGLNLLWLALLLLGAFCIGAPYRMGAAALTGGALAMATPMVLLSQAGSAANDVVGIAFLVAALGLVLNAGGEPRAEILAAVAAGLAVSVKLSLLAPALALTAGVLLWRRRRAARWVVGFVVAASFWYLRNLVAVGNPLPWLDLPGLAVPAPPLQAHTGFSVAHYLGTSGIWNRVLEPGLASGLGSWWWAVLAATVIGPLLCLLPGGGARVRLVGGVGLVSLLAYLVTPESAAGPAGHPLGFAFNLRYGAPALTLCLVALPLAPLWRRGVVRWLPGALLALLLVVTLSRARVWPSAYLPGQLVVGLVVLGGFLVGAALLAAGRRPGVVAMASAAGLAMLVLIALGFRGQRRYFHARYTFQPGISQLSPVWAWFRRVQGARVGIVGTYGGFFAYPLFGVDGSNRVQYIAARGPHGSFTPTTSCSAWRTAVNRAGLRYLVTTPARDPWQPKILSSSPERGWTAGDPGASVAFETPASGQRVTVFRLRGRLDPARCG